MYATRRIGLDQIHEFPGNVLGRDLRSHGRKRDARNHALKQATNCASSSSIDVADLEREFAVDQINDEVDVVDANYFSSVNVDDLLIEEIAFEQEHSLRTGERSPRRERVCRADASVDALEAIAGK